MNTLRFLIVAAAVLWASPAAAFCGFYVAGGDAKLFNEATQVVLMRQDDRTALSMQNNYEGPPEGFAMVIPVPQVLQEEDVKTLPKEVFDRVDTMTAPRLVEYWEQDPCNPWVDSPKGGMVQPRMAMRSSVTSDGAGEPLVVIEAQFDVGEYQVVILSAKESTALETWLKQEKYNIPAGAEPYFRPYIEAGQYFFVARVNPAKVKFEAGRAVLSPLRFSYQSERFELPVRLGMINSKGEQDLLVYIIARDQRYEVANYPNVFIPTNLEVAASVKAEFGGFYRALFDRVTEENPGAVVTEYAWATSSCDPCPGPVITASDVLTLGADVVSPGDRGQGWAVTRLHARYTRDQIGEDLVFAKVGPVAGGNEWRKEDGNLSTTAEPASSNTFQGRYIIRHEWSGSVECASPQRGVWGGPPSNPRGKPGVSANPSPNTTGRKGAPAAVDLKAALKTPLAITDKLPKSATDTPPAAPADELPTASTTAGGAPVPATPAAAPTSRCSVATVASGGLGPAFLIFALAAATRRRRSSIQLNHQPEESHDD